MAKLLERHFRGKQIAGAASFPYRNRGSLPLPLLWDKAEKRGGLAQVPELVAFQV